MCSNIAALHLVTSCYDQRTVGIYFVLNFKKLNLIDINLEDDSRFCVFYSIQKVTDLLK